MVFVIVVVVLAVIFVAVDAAVVVFVVVVVVVVVGFFCCLKVLVLKTKKDYNMCSRPDEQTLAQHVQQELHEVDGTGVVATGLPPTGKVKLT